MEKTVIYKVVVKVTKAIELENSLPFNSTDKEEINSNITFNKIDHNGFNPQIKLPKDKETQSGRHLTIYDSQGKIFFPLKSGSYSYYHDENDKEGYVTDIIIYDEESKLLYFERQRYYAFQ